MNEQTMNEQTNNNIKVDDIKVDNVVVKKKVGRPKLNPKIKEKRKIEKMLNKMNKMKINKKKKDNYYYDHKERIREYQNNRYRTNENFQQKKREYNAAYYEKHKDKWKKNGVYYENRAIINID